MEMKHLFKNGNDELKKLYAIAKNEEEFLEEVYNFFTSQELLKCTEKSGFWRLDFGNEITVSIFHSTRVPKTFLIKFHDFQRFTTNLIDELRQWYKDL